MTLKPHRPVAALLCLLCAKALCARSDPYVGWTRAQTPEAIVISDLSPKTIVEIAAEYTVFRRQVLNQLALPGQKIPPAVLLVIDNEDLLKRLIIPPRSVTNLVSYTTSIGTTPLLAISYESRDKTLPMMYEADVGALLPRLGYFAPLWVAQGTGEVFSSMDIENKKVVVGGENDILEPIWDNNTSQRWSKFFEVSSGSRSYKDENDSQNFGVYQAQAWILMHTILFTAKGESMRDRMVALDKALRKGPAGEDTVAGVLGIKADYLDSVVIHHSTDLTRLTFPIDLQALKASIHPAPIPAPEVEVYCAELEVNAGNPDASDYDLDRAILTAPDDPIVNEAMGRRHLREGDLREAVRYFKVAEDKGATVAETYFYTAVQALNDNGGEIGGGGPALPQVIDELHKALAMDPANSKIYAELGRAYACCTTLTEAMPGELTPGINDNEDGLHVLYYQAILYNRLGRLADARNAYTYIADNSTDATFVEKAAHDADLARVDADAKALTALAGKGQFDEALAVIEAGEKAARSQFGHNTYARFRAQLLQMKEASGLLALYHAKAYEKFIAGAQGFIARYPRSQNARKLRSLVEEAQTALDQAPVAPLPDGALKKDAQAAVAGSGT